ncbi:MAG: hypothetical protein A3F11_04295 [Gammaproteobacteria bacterium RIFCSPHIGHO2_12_FULL_37_14]|nr:MAG: hypothetical protein A3F11_04295 [Gammaproteobacteria bacterium RIFCSPHIGHO2_12_FULL_37_14]
MANTRPNYIEQIESAATPEYKAPLTKVLWNHAREHGTPLIMQVDGKYQAIFLFQSNEPGLNVRLKSADLHDRLIKDSKDGQTELFKHIPGTDIYYLKVSALPPDASAEYTIQLGDPPNERYVSDSYSKHQTTKQRLHLSTHNDSSTVVSESVSYMLMPKAVLPMAAQVQSASDIKLTQETFHSERFPMFQDRSVFTYKSDDFNPETGKVIFMLDGRDFCESICPGLSALSKDSSNPLSNTAIVFIDSKMETHRYKYGDFNHKPYPDSVCTDKDELLLPDRVYEFYFRKNDFSEMLSKEIIPHYKLGVTNSEQIILAGHSLAAYPVLDVAAKHSADIGGIILISPALNQNQPVGLPDSPDQTLKSLPIYMQIGQLEDTKLPISDQGEKDMKDKSRIESNHEFHRILRDHDYNVASTLPIHSYGHSNIHALQGLQEGLRHIQEHRFTVNETRRFTH